jgi:ubiquinone/menaquinone biosynthesis C-methylase UbiE
MFMDPATTPTGVVLHAPRFYDFIVWMITLGRERRLRRRFVELARLAPGESVLDVGCGTGSLALAATQRVGPTGRVHGIDASVPMIARAKAKAEREGATARFETATAQALPFPDGTFDAVLCTLMLHHLGKGSRQQAAHELRRVGKPGGRALLVDFTQSTRGHRGFRFGHPSHGSIAPQELTGLLEESGFAVLESGQVGALGLHFALGKAL